ELPTKIFRWNEESLGLIEKKLTDSLHDLNQYVSAVKDDMGGRLKKNEPAAVVTPPPQAEKTETPAPPLAEALNKEVHVTIHLKSGGVTAGILLNETEDQIEIR